MQITLLDCGEKRGVVITIIRRMTGWHLDKVVAFIDNCPGQLEANEAQIEELRSAGAELNIQEKNTYTARTETSQKVQPAANQKHMRNKDLWYSWKNLSAGHEQVIKVLSDLHSFTEEYREELLVAKSEWEDTKVRNQETYDSVVSNAEETFEEEQKRFLKECDNNINITAKRKDTVKVISDACSTFVHNLRGYTSITSISTSASDLCNIKGIACKAASDELPFVKAKEAEVMAAIDAKIQAYKDLRICQNEESERARNDKMDQARADQLDRDKQAERDFEAKYKSICKDCRTDISKVFNKAAVCNYQQEIRSTRFNADRYECPTEIPAYIMLGDIGITIPNKDRNDMSIVQALEQELQSTGAGTKQGEKYVVKIPYAQRLSDGISLLIRYAPSDRKDVQQLIQPLLFKLFMSFPAGKLEATMIDPVELGTSFQDISRLASSPDSARIIDKKIWSKEKDIENAIAILRQQLENMAQSYAGNQESRLEKEPLKALAITDFPAGFTDIALKDLHAIVRKSAFLGVCVLICANDAELTKLKQRNGALVSTLTQNMVETKAAGNRLKIIGNHTEHMFLQLDEMRDVMEKKEEILSLISDAIEHTPVKVEHFESMYKEDIYDSNNWFTGKHGEIALPIGIKGADIVVKMVLGRGGGSTEHHALICGQTGAGKSTLLHTLIMSTLISYSPDEVQMYLLDFKEGVEFSAYTRYRLPSLRVVAINSEREFGLSILKELCTEFKERTKYFNRYAVSDIDSYEKLLDVPKVSKLIMIFDEVQELLRSREGKEDSISRECLNCIGQLVMQGRAAGIHVILASQDFHNCTGLETYFNQMAIRIAVKGSEEGAASILASDNPGIRTLQDRPAGAAIYNGGNGAETANNFFQVSYISKEERFDLLSRLDAYFTDPEVAPLYEEQQTRVLLTNAEDNINNCFNKLILDGINSVTPLGSHEDGYGLLLGQGFGKKSIFVPELRAKAQDNLLIVSKDEKMAMSLFELSVMSVLYENLHTNTCKTRALVYIADLFADELDDGECGFDFLETQFPKQVRVAKTGDIEELVSILYETVVDRMEGRISSDERIFFLFFGIHRARRMRIGSVDEKECGDGLSAIEKLRKIITDGSEYGVNSMIWGESIRGIELMLGGRYEAMFNKYIAYGLDAESMESLVQESDTKSLCGKTAVYMDIGGDAKKNVHFRPYEVPAAVWVERYAECYQEVIGEGGC